MSAWQEFIIGDVVMFHAGGVRYVATVVPTPDNLKEMGEINVMHHRTGSIQTVVGEGLKVIHRAYEGADDGPR